MVTNALTDFDDCEDRVCAVANAATVALAFIGEIIQTQASAGYLNRTTADAAVFMLHAGFDAAQKAMDTYYECHAAAVARVVS